jgi:hypothetical protein
MIPGSVELLATIAAGQPGIAAAIGSLSCARSSTRRVAHVQHGHCLQLEALEVIEPGRSKDRDARPRAVVNLTFVPCISTSPTTPRLTMAIRAPAAPLTGPKTGSHDRSAIQETAADQRKRQPSGYFSSCLAMTTRWIWLVPS